MYYQRYALVLKKYRDMISLTKYANVIEEAILSHFPEAQNITVNNHDYSFETLTIPERGELVAIGQFISYNSPLNKIVVQYNSKTGKHQPARKLFYCVEKNYPVEKRNKQSLQPPLDEG
jgi:hypothetical protein